MLYVVFPPVPVSSPTLPVHQNKMPAHLILGYGRPFQTDDVSSPNQDASAPEPSCFDGELPLRVLDFVAGRHVALADDVHLVDFAHEFRICRRAGPSGTGPGVSALGSSFVLAPAPFLFQLRSCSSLVLALVLGVPRFCSSFTRASSSWRGSQLARVQRSCAGTMSDMPQARRPLTRQPRSHSVRS